MPRRSLAPSRSPAVPIESLILTPPALIRSLSAPSRSRPYTTMPLGILGSLVEPAFVQSSLRRTATSTTLSHKPTDNFRRYNGPPKSKRTHKRRVDPCPHILLIDIDDILRSNSAGLGPIPECARDAVKRGDIGTCGMRYKCPSGDQRVLTCPVEPNHHARLRQPQHTLEDMPQGS